MCVLYVGEIGVMGCEDDYVFKTACECVWWPELGQTATSQAE